MAHESSLILLALTYLATKHMVADFLLQTPYQYQNKGTYGHPGGLLHSAIHVVATAPVFAILVPSALVGLVVLVVEFAIHYHIDWIKEYVVRRGALTVQTPSFWYAFGIDQLAHTLTYIGIVTVLVSS